MGASGVDERWSDFTVNWRLIQRLPSIMIFIGKVVRVISIYNGL